MSQRDLPSGITIHVAGAGGSYRGGPDELDRVILALEAAPGAVRVGWLARVLGWARAPSTQRVEIGVRTIRVWRDLRAPGSSTAIPRASVRAIAVATRVRGALRAIDAGAADGPVHVVVRHAGGPPTPLVEELASLDDAIAVARVLHGPLAPAVELDLPARA